MRWLSLVFWIALCLGVGAVGGRWTAPEIGAWYRTLRKPFFNPPNWIFGPVWTLLYLLMAVAAWLVSQSAPSTLRSAALGLFLAQLALNLAWSWIFFRRHALGGALAEVLLLWLAIGATTLVFARVAPAAGWLLLPYWGWTSFASLLNAAIWRLNPNRTAASHAQPHLP
jgi:benzodiazapine receptor